MDRSTTEWAVLGLIAESPTHGFAVAKQLRSDGGVGRIWTVSRPLVYRAISTLATQRSIMRGERVPGDGGPRRQLWTVSPLGREQIDRWLRAPVPSVRDLRSELLLKLVLLDRVGRSAGPLLEAQAALLQERTEQLRRRTREADGFDRTLLSWRATNTAAAKQFVDQALDDLASERRSTRRR